MAVCPCWPYIHWKLRLESETTAKKMSLHVSVLCGCPVSRGSRQSLCPCAWIVRWGLCCFAAKDMYLCMCERGKVSGFLLAHWDTPYPWSVVSISGSQWNAGKQRWCLISSYSNHSCLQSWNSQQVNNARTATVLESKMVFMKCTWDF